MNPVIAVYPGTFDPMTLGHEELVRRASQLFGHLIVAVAAGHHKKPMFDLAERLDMVQQAVARFPNVTVESYDGLLRDFVVARGARAMVRGLRAVTDFDYQFVSSTYVREIATLGGEVHQLVSPGVFERLMAKSGRL